VPGRGGDECVEERGDVSKYIMERVQKLASRYNPVKGLFDSWLTPDPC